MGETDEGSMSMPDQQLPTETGERPVPSGFDAMCSEVEDFELLPVAPVPASPVPDPKDEERTAPLDKLILAGLVSP